MTVEKMVEGNTAILNLQGWMDTQSAPVFADALNDLEPEVENLILDLAGMEYTSSAGIREIILAYKKMNGSLTLRNVTPAVMDVLNMTGVGKKLHIES